MGKVTYAKDCIYTGYMGNCFFQTAATIGIAKKNNMEYVFPPSEFTSKYFYGLTDKIPVNPSAKSLHTEDYAEYNYHYDPVVLDPTKNYNLIGYFQTAKYWSHCEPLIREVFEFNEDVKSEVFKKYNTILESHNDNPYLIAIHVRRGDYLNHPDNHPVMPITYYANGARYIINTRNLTQRWADGNVKFVIFSDDQKWCKENFPTEEIFQDRLVFAEDNDQVHDMCLMTQCSSFVISNSSFSWWGSFLSTKDSRKIIVAPKKEYWYGIKYSSWKLDDLYRDEWVCIDLK